MHVKGPAVHLHRHCVKGLMGHCLKGWSSMSRAPKLSMAPTSGVGALWVPGG